jgi:D-galactose 1-dehydrogenase
VSELRIAIVGFGVIARKRHVPAIAETPGARLVAIADPNAVPGDVPHFTGLKELLRDGPPFDAVALCTPPQVRGAQAAMALAAGKHVLLEKPPGKSLGEIAPLRTAAEAAGRTLFTAWHSQFAAAVEPARQLLASRRIARVTVTWKEDVRVWHPGQAWIFQPGGLGVFDPGINALSILTRVMPLPLFVTHAELDIPVNCAAPIAAELGLADAAGLQVEAAFDFRQVGPQTWDIRFETDHGPLILSSGGARLTDGDRVLVDAKKDVKKDVGNGEYPLLYRRFVELAERGDSDVDLAPFQLVADCFLLGRWREVEAFEDRT